MQNFWKHIQSFGLVKLYASDGEIRKNFKFLQALAFVPKKDVIFCLNQIKANCPNKFKPMLSYFEKYYVGNLKRIVKVFGMCQCLQSIYGISTTEL